MVRAASLSLPVIAIALLATGFSDQFRAVETLLGILVIVSFAVIAVGWTVDHDVID